VQLIGDASDVPGPPSFPIKYLIYGRECARPTCVRPQVRVTAINLVRVVDCSDVAPSRSSGEVSRECYDIVLNDTPSSLDELEVSLEINGSALRVISATLSTRIMKIF